jgi:hypothetical protein
VVDFVGGIAEGLVDVGDTWELVPRTKPVAGVATASVEFRRNGGFLGDMIPPGAMLVVEQFNASGNPAAAGTHGLAVRVVPTAGFVDYFAWAAANGLGGFGSSTSDPFLDVRGHGILNATQFLFGLDGTDYSKPSLVQSFVMDAEGRKAQLSYVRRAGVDASYTPYFSEDLKRWIVAPVSILSIVPVPGTDLETVTLKSIHPIFGERMFFRLQPNFNPDDFEVGLIPETFEDKLVNGSSVGSLRALDQSLVDNNVLVTYQAIPGRVLFFNVTGQNRDNGGSIYGGTAPDGVTRDFIYQDRSQLSVAAVHAGLLDIGERGLIKVTLLDPRTELFGSTQITKDGSETVESEPGSPTDPPGDDPYCYMVELYRILDTD